MHEGGALIEGLDNNVISPQFYIRLPAIGPCLFQLGLYATDKRGITTFRHARGRGRMELKCLSQLPGGIGKTDFSITIGEGTHVQQQQLWVSHDFSEKARWNMRKCDFSTVDPCTRTLTLNLCFLLPGSIILADP